VSFVQIFFKIFSLLAQPADREQNKFDFLFPRIKCRQSGHYVNRRKKNVAIL
jgi:hypothetical protein